MAAPGKQSRWGSFLSQAVAGVESRLDNILAERDEAPAQNPVADTPTTTVSPVSTSRPASPTSMPTTTSTSTAAKIQQSSHKLVQPAKLSVRNSRSSSRGGVNDRLQARLAQAMAGKAGGSGTASRASASPRSSVDQASRPSIERKSTDKGSSASQDSAISNQKSERNSASSKTKHSDDLQTEKNIEINATQVPKHVPDARDTASIPCEELDTYEGQEPTSSKPGDSSDIADHLQVLKAKQQEEIREYIERIDSLQSKLQYLSKTATEAAKNAAASAPPGSLEQKLAERDEKIALLMEEGQKLSTNEHQLRTTIKRLRVLVGEQEKQLGDLRTHRDKVLSEAEALRARLDFEDLEKRQDETNRATSALQKEVDLLKREISKKDEAYRRQEQEWRKRMEETEAAHRDAMNKAIHEERQRQRTLEEMSSILRTEKETAIEQARQEAIEWREKLERAHERARKTEEDLKIDLQVVEGKLEAMRVAAEEASSGFGGEAQVKMFRQLETLQSQYASARENWQGIEASLIAKSAALEKEKDDAQRRESDMRKKARDAALRLKVLEDELQDVQPALVSTRRELDACRGELAELQTSYKSCESSLFEAREELKLRRGVADKVDGVEAEQQQWVDNEAGASNRGHSSRPQSPNYSISRTFSSDLLGITGQGSKSRHSHTPGSTPDTGSAEIMSPNRRSTGQTPIRTMEPSYAGSGPPPTPFSFFGSPSESGQFPSPAAAEQDHGPLESIPSPPRHVAQDMVSVSTVAAGPSVQLVERMSAAIRRLEAEKVTAKEEMARVCSQRDEARSDLVALMKDIEKTKAAALKVPQLEQEVASLDSRYQTTLEMLGEKSELVEELKADVEDVKAMYRELVERTVK